MTSDAQKRATKKYNSEKLDHVHLRLQKGKRSEIESHAKSQGESVNGFINRAIDETMKRDQDK